MTSTTYKITNASLGHPFNDVNWFSLQSKLPPAGHPTLRKSIRFTTIKTSTNRLGATSKESTDYICTESPLY
jgi:hypothetical protein